MLSTLYMLSVREAFSSFKTVQRFRVISKKPIVLPIGFFSGLQSSRGKGKCPVTVINSEKSRL